MWRLRRRWKDDVNRVVQNMKAKVFTLERRWKNDVKNFVHV